MLIKLLDKDDEVEFGDIVVFSSKYQSEKVFMITEGPGGYSVDLLDLNEYKIKFKFNSDNSEQLHKLFQKICTKYNYTGYELFKAKNCHIIMSKEQFK